MVDHHVDRPGVKAQQCVKLTGTNRSFGLIQSLPSHAANKASTDQEASTTTLKTLKQLHFISLTRALRCDDLVVMARG